MVKTCIHVSVMFGETEVCCERTMHLEFTPAVGMSLFLKDDVWLHVTEVNWYEGNNSFWVDTEYEWCPADVWEKDPYIEMMKKAGFNVSSWGE